METKINVLERFAKWLVNEGKAAATDNTKETTVAYTVTHNGTKWVAAKK